MQAAGAAGAGGSHCWHRGGGWHGGYTISTISTTSITATATADYPYDSAFDHPRRCRIVLPQLGLRRVYSHRRRHR